MRALTLTQPWAGLVAAGIKGVENRPRKMIKREDFGKRFAIHASRVIDESVYERIAEIAPGVIKFERRGDKTIPVVPCLRDWYPLSRITGAAIAVATLDCAMRSDDAYSSQGLSADQLRWFFGPIGYVLRDVIALSTPVPCRGFQGFWTLDADTERRVMEQLA